MNNTFDIIVQAALSGSRCPTNAQLGCCGTTRLGQMAARGDILIEVYTRNFRRVTILTGEHKGKHTLNPPMFNGRLPKPYLVVNTNGTFCNGKQIDPGAASRGKPSPPRFTRAASISEPNRAEASVDIEPFHHLKLRPPHEFKAPNVHPSIQNKIRGGRA